MNYLLIDNPIGEDKGFNVGDDIQVVAAKRFYNDFKYINKYKLAYYNGEPAKIIMNGWFCHADMDWPPSDDLQPKYISFHINSAAEKRMLDEKGVSYLKKYEPIGCRDVTTLAMLKKHNIDAYYSACITLTLKRSRFTQNLKRKGVIINDISYKQTRYLNKNIIKFILKGQFKKLKKYRINNKLIKNFVSQSIDNIDITYTKHSLPLSSDDREFRYKTGQNLLKKYAEAELVITSRIHCALPCLALETPVIFIDDSLNHSSERSRLDGLIDFFHIIRIERNQLVIPKEITQLDSLKSLRNKETYKEFRDLIIRKLNDF
jgi:polysaccharide pyruvyl transferase WcaK-like protein